MTKCLTINQKGSPKFVFFPYLYSILDGNDGIVVFLDLEALEMARRKINSKHPCFQKYFWQAYLIF